MVEANDGVLKTEFSSYFLLSRQEHTTR